MATSSPAQERQLVPMESMNRRLDSILKSKKKLEEANAGLQQKASSCEVNSQNRRDLIIPHAAQNVHAHNPKKSSYGIKGKFTFLLM